VPALGVHKFTAFKAGVTDYVDRYYEQMGKGNSDSCHPDLIFTNSLMGTNAISQID
jgi:hypothetical protein